VFTLTPLRIINSWAGLRVCQVESGQRRQKNSPRILMLEKKKTDGSTTNLADGLTVTVERERP